MRKYLLGFSLIFFSYFPLTAHSFCCPCLPWLLDYQPSGFSVGAFGGITGGYELDCEDVETNRGYYCGIQAGKKVFPNVRLEGDLIWQGNDVNRITVQNTTDLDHPRGSFNIGSIMANAILDLNFPFPGSPSLGAGIGYAYANGHWSGILTQTNETLAIERKLKSSFHKGGLSWQIIADLNFFICPTLKINIEYRFFKLSHQLSNNKFGLALVKFF